MASARWAPALLPFVVLVATGLRGIDFGFHWDEPYHVGTLRYSIEHGVPLPGDYRYPAVSYWLDVAAALPDLARAARAPSDDAARAQLVAAVEGKAWRLRARTLFLLVTSASVLAVYGLVLLWRESVGEALFAASVLGLSWQLAYHARWIAPDGILVLFASATLLCAVQAARRPPARRWLWAGAISAGLAIGTKWPAGLLLVPVWIAAWQGSGDAPLRERLWLCVKLGAAAGLVYLVTTPGTLLEWRALRHSLQMQQDVYSRGHLGHRVSPGPEHLLRVGEWLVLSFGSRWAAVSVAFSALAAVGVVALVRESRRLALLFLAFPVLYLAFFSAYRAVIVRNYLVITPFFAVLAARGLALLLERVPRGAPRAALAGIAAAALLANALWLARAAESIHSRADEPVVRELAAHLAAHPGVRYAASPRVLADLHRDGFRPGAHVGRALGGADEVVVYASEAYGHLVACRPGFGLTTTWFGPFDVDLDYYPGWLGPDRIVVLPAAHYPTRNALPPEAPPELRPGALTEIAP